MGASPLRIKGQVGTGQASGDGPVVAREEGAASKGPEEVAGVCGIIPLPREEEEIVVSMERSPSRGWPGIVVRPESGF